MHGHIQCNNNGRCGLAVQLMEPRTIYGDPYDFGHLSLWLFQVFVGRKLTRAWLFFVMLIVKEIFTDTGICCKLELSKLIFAILNTHAS